ncbi:MAG: hypothetical protein ACU4EQ_08405 [Candidatus Nitrosoglobus sp.]|jgi:hypothetical protein
MTYVSFSEAAASSEDNILLGFLNSVSIRRDPIHILLRMALLPLLMGLIAIPKVWAVPSFPIRSSIWAHWEEIPATALASTIAAR